MCPTAAFIPIIAAAVAAHGDPFVVLASLVAAVVLMIMGPAPAIAMAVAIVVVHVDLAAHVTA